MYNFNNPVRRRGTQSVKWDGVTEDLFPMWVADTDFPAPPAVLKALRDRVDHGVFGYGISDDLTGIVCKWMREEFNVTVEEDWIIILPGIVTVLRMLSHLREGPVMINTPNYNDILDAPLLAGNNTVLSPLKNENEKYTMDFGDMQKRLDRDVQLFYFCNPHNPVGRVYTKEELLELSSFARNNKLLIVSDEAHCGLCYDRPHVPWFSVDEYARERSITVFGPGKTFNIPGLPLGIAVIPNKELRQEFKNVGFVLRSPAVLSVIAAKAAFSESAEWKNKMVDYLRQNRDFLESFLMDALPAVKFTHVEGTYLQWADFRPLGIDDPFQWLQDHPKIFTSDGRIFGGEGYVRLNFGTTRGQLEAALNRIKERVKELHKKKI